MMRAWISAGLWILSVLSSGTAAQDLAPTAATRLAEQFQARAYAPDLLAGVDLANADLTGAEQVQDAYVVHLKQHLGGVVGYKAGLTSVTAQQHLGVDHPLLGFLLRDMLVPSPAQLAVQSGARLVVEADLLLRVADVIVNDARNWDDLLRAMDQVIPFIEVPDLLYAPDVRISAPLLQAANVGARWGVLGTPIPLHAGEDWYQRLADFQAVLELPAGEIVRGQGRDLLGHPLAVVEWLNTAVQARGRHLRPGDLLSLGSLTPLRPAQAGQLHAVYTGLDPAGPVTVDLEFIADAVPSSTTH